MNIVLYKCEDSQNTINKGLNDGLSLNVKTWGDVNPKEFSLTLSNKVIGFNYMVNIDTGHCYFVDNIESLTNKVVRMFFKLDVLETYKKDILNSVTNFKRPLKDGDYQNISFNNDLKKSYEKISCDGKGFSGSTMVLSVIGG